MAKANSYGIKEVADVKFYPVASAVTLNKIASIAAVPTFTITPKEVSEGADAHYSFDSLKVSNIEVASEDVSARGGKGNPELISWSYGKEVTFTMEDALLSMETLDLMFGAKEAISKGLDTPEGETREKGTIGDVLTVDANSFPGYYTIVGTTVMRSYATGKDEPFVFIIPKAKVQVNGSLTMEAEGDPSTMELTIKAMAADFSFTNGDTTTTSKDVLVQFAKPVISA